MDEDTTLTEPTIEIAPAVSADDLKQMISTGNYDPAIVKSVTCKRKGQRMAWFFTLTDDSKVTI